MLTMKLIIGCLLPICLDGAFDVEKIVPLPAEKGKVEQPGYAGPFVGKHNKVLLVAGGANFPGGVPWKKQADGRDSVKKYHDSIFVYKEGEWAESQTKLPHVVAYGGSVSHEKHGLLCVGGEWRIYPEGKRVNGISKKVYSLKWDKDKVIIDKSFPSLPAGRANFAIGLSGDVVYVLSGSASDGASDSFWALDLNKYGREDFKWVELNSFEGGARSHCVGVVQHDGLKNCFFVFGGRNKGPTGWTFYNDSWKFVPDEKANPLKGKWKKQADCVIDDKKISLTATVVFKIGLSHISFLGGADPDSFILREWTLSKKITAAKKQGRTIEAEKIENEKTEMFDKHPGFSKQMLMYNAITNTWAKAGELPFTTPVTTSAVEFDGNIVVVNGEIRPGVRTADVLLLKTKKGNGFSTIAYVVLGLYFFGIILNGLYFSKRMKNTDDFFKAGGRIPWWAAGLSIFGTQLSAITFIAIPATVYMTNWQNFVGNMTIFLVAPLIILFFLPFYRRLNITTAYEYLEMRFDITMRVLGSLIFIVMQFTRIAIVLLLPSIALSVATGMNQDVCILIMGGMCILYTYLGGMEAVVWTDVTQVIILTVGALVAFIMLINGIDGGLTGYMDIAENAGKINLLNFSFDPSEATFFTLLIGGLGLNIIAYGSDQSVIQRYLTTKDESEARKSIWTNAFLTIPASLLFFGIGTAMYAYYSTNPAEINPGITNAQALFPFYIVNNMPAAIAGLLIASVFAASMSSLDSSMNSVSATVTTDMYRRFKTNVDEKSCLKVAKATIVFVGLFGTCFALWMAHSNIRDLWDHVIHYIGFVGGGLGGVFLLAIFTKRANSRGVLLGLLGSAVLQYFVKEHFQIHSWLLGTIGIVNCFLLGYLFSFMGERNKNIEGLTIYTLKKKS
jgi:SSS family solute:Na+ symporter